MEVNIPFRFINEATKAFYNTKARHACLCGGFGSGKTYVMCFKALTLCAMFDGYRVLIGRFRYKDLKNTTMRTFYKICEPGLYDPKKGGKRDDREGYLRLINGSEILFIHLDEFDESILRGLELNSAFIDQAEEVPEGIVDVLDTRLGRWDCAKPSKNLLTQGIEFEKNEFGRYKVPAYFGITCNPDNETHWIWRQYHPDSPNRRPGYEYYEVSSEDNPLLSEETLRIMKSRDPSWVQRFVYGKWGISEATIHRILSSSIINPPKEWIENLLSKSNLYRSFDHGEVAPSCMLWIAAWRNQFFVYREYYQANTLISEHRKNIQELSGDEQYVISVADPSIFRKTAQKYGGFWTVADEYMSSEIPYDPIPFIPGDNNELATRNRINELLALDERYKHPLTNESPAPRLYFIERDPSHSFGCYHAIEETRNQRRVKLGTINGKDIYGDERVQGVPDHAYDALRMFVALHLGSRVEPKPKPSENSFIAARRRIKALKLQGVYNKYGDLAARI